MRVLPWILVFAVGCGEQSYDSAKTTRAPAAANAAKDWLPGTKAEPRADAGESEAKVPSAETLRRKIIYTATIDLVVEEFTSIPSEVEALAKQFDAYVANSNILGSPGSPRSGQWKIRVPVERYKEFLEAARKLGEVRSERSDSQDVSEEYYDLEARIRNKKQQEERLLELLADATGKLEEVLSVERELARVRGEIEQMEGRIRVLNNLTSLTTVNLSIDEIKDYVPEEAATYTTRLRRSFGNSIHALKTTAETVSIAVIVALPWLGVLLVPVILLVILVRIARRRRR